MVSWDKGEESYDAKNNIAKGMQFMIAKLGRSIAVGCRAQPQITRLFTRTTGGGYSSSLGNYLNGFEKEHYKSNIPYATAYYIPQFTSIQS